MKNYELIKFKDNDIELDVEVSPNDDTVWLSKEQMAILFDRDRSVITRHIKSIYNEGELDRNSSCAKNAHEVNGQTHYTEYYNLDVVLAVGHRVKSKRGEKLKLFLNSYFNVKYCSGNNIIIYNNGNITINVDVSPNEQTVWLDERQMSELFDTTRQAINYHINNILDEEEMGDRCCKEILRDVGDGRKYEVKLYNLDMILAVGYRVKTKLAIQFRKWATDVLKQYLLKGYVIDENRAVISFDNYLQLVNDVSNLKAEMKDTREKILLDQVKEKLFFAGQVLDANDFISSIIARAKEHIILIDPYADEKALSYLKKKNDGVSVTLYKSSESKLQTKDINDYEAQCGEIRIFNRDDIHDRFLITESECYLLGTSLNYIGKRMFAIIKIENKTFIELLMNYLKQAI